MRRYPVPQPADLRALADLEAPVLSLLVPVTAAVPDAAQNPVRHERVVARGLERLRELGAEPALVERARRELADFASDSSSPEAGIAARAAYWSPDGGTRTFGLPFPVDETARVGSCAVVRPLARAAQRPGRYRVLRLSANRVELYEGGEAGLQRVEAAQLPKSLEDALGGELSEPALQMHSSSGGGTRPVYHGQGGASRERRVDQERFHRRVARGLEAAIGEDVVPLVLAADARHRPGLERALHRDVGLVPTPLEGNAEHLSPAELHRHTWPLAVAHADAERAREDARRDAKPLTRLSEIVEGAVMGRIRRLWLPAAGEVPARLDPDQASAAEAWGDDDLIESLAVQVLRRGGSVRVEDEPRAEAPHGVAADLW